jgi:hypothetical protein
MTYVYPTNDLQDKLKVLGLLGSFWVNVYDGRTLVADITQTRLEEEQQNFQDMEETVLAVARRTVPIHHTENWHHVRLLRSEMNSTDAALWRFDEVGLPAFDALPGFTFDEPFNTAEYTFDIPTNLAEVDLIQDGITSATTVLHRGLDFRLDLDRAALIFREDPFSNTDLTQEQVFEDGVITDQAITLWAFRAMMDWRLPFVHHGFILGLELTSSQEYKNLINATLDAIVGGTSRREVEELVAQLAGLPLVRGAEETVEDVADDLHYTLVLTDQNVYKFPKTVTTTVTTGDTVLEGDSLVDDFELIEFRRGQSSDNLMALVMGKGMLSSELFGEIMFENIDVPLTVTGATDSERVEFALGGHPLDTEQFWDIVHDRRLTYGSSLYDLLAAEVGGVPTTVNPMEFLIENVLRNNAFAIRLRAAGFGENALGLGPGILLRRIMPPHVTLLLVIELTTLTDSVNINNVDTSGLGVFDGMEPMTLEVGAGNATLTKMTAKFTSFVCQGLTTTACD